MTFIDTDEPDPPVGLAPPERGAGDAAAKPGRIPDFALFSAAQCVSSVGSWMQKTAFGWLIWELTHSTAWVGAMGIADLVALLWVAPLAGPLTDRANPFRLLTITQSALFALSAGLWLCIVSGNLTIWALWLFALVESTLQGFNQPVRMTAAGLLAGRERMSQAVAANSIGTNTARSVGPMIAGIVIATWGAAPVFAIDAVSFVAMLTGIWWFRAKLDRPGFGTDAPLRAAIVGSFATVVRDRRVASVLLLAASFSLFARPFFEMLPAFAGSVFGGDPHVLASLLTGQGLGALCGALLMLRRHDDRRLARIATIAGVALAIAIFAFARSTHLALALPLMVAAGLAHVISNIAMQSLLQLRAQPGTRGQALSLYSLLFRAAPSLGALPIGVAATRWGLAPVMGLCAFLAGGMILWFGRSVRYGDGTRAFTRAFDLAVRVSNACVRISPCSAGCAHRSPPATRAARCRSIVCRSAPWCSRAGAGPPSRWPSRRHCSSLRRRRHD